MKSISLYVSERAYEDLKSMAARSGRPVAELVREAMAQYVARERRQTGSIVELVPHHSGKLRREWTRAELLDEMLGR